MTLSTPIIGRIITFDPTLEYQIPFYYSDGQIKNKQIIIKNADTGATVFTGTEEGGRLTYTILPFTLKVGKYTVQLKIEDYYGNSSEYSSSSLFECKSSPKISFVNLPERLNKADVQLNVSYYQAQDDTISEMIYYLYDDSKVLLSKSETFFENKSYTFYGLENGRFYYVRCVVRTSSGMEADTGYYHINAYYMELSNNVVLNLKNERCNGYISIDANIIDIGYEMTGDADGSYSFNDGEVTLYGNTTVTYDTSENLTDEFGIFVKARKLTIDVPFLIIKTDGGDITLTIKEYGGEYYCVLEANSYLDKYYRYAIMPKVALLDNASALITDENGTIFNQVTMDYEDGYTAVFEVRRKYGLFSLYTYYENDSVIIKN